MDLSPNDIRNYEFPNQMRGYDKDEVDSFLDQIAMLIENMKQESLRLSMENDSIKSQLENLQKIENAIKSAAIDARKNADNTMAEAKEESEKMIADAKELSEKLVSSQEEKISDYDQQLERLERTKRSFIDELNDMIRLHLNMVNKVSDQQFSFTPDPTGTIEVTDSEEVSRNEMNTIASEPKPEQIITEEANAAKEIIPVVAEEEAPLDPELAKALAGFEQPEPNSETVSPETMIGADSIPKQGEVIETTKRAEDIPDGFIASESDLVKQKTENPIIENYDDADDDSETGKMNLSPDAQAEPTEHNNIDIDESEKTSINPDNIVAELDNVVAKFEEEMDKAEKSH